MLRDPGVFDAAWVPGDLRHREEELEDLASILDSYRATPIRIIGPSGVGKTATVRYALDDIGLHLDGVETAYVDAWDQHRPSRTLHALLEELTPELERYIPDRRRASCSKGSARPSTRRRWW